MVFRALFEKIKRGLAKTRGVFSGVASLFRLKGRVDEDFLKKLEERLYLADVGTATTFEIVGSVRQSFKDKDITGDVEAFVTQAHLMRELEKIHRVVTKQIEGAPHEVLLVLDATNGQNAIAQAEMFKKTVKCTGIILAKLDGTAKGGAIFAIKQRLDLPVKFIGVGETPDDLEPFNPDDYVEALFE